jgi:hypothetical protein
MPARRHTHGFRQTRARRATTRMARVNRLALHPARAIATSFQMNVKSLASIVAPLLNVMVSSGLPRPEWISH